MDQNSADALNKALDLAKQGVVSAFETVKQYAPMVWGLVKRQITIDGYELLGGGLLTIAVTTALLKLIWWNAKDDDYGFDKTNGVIATLITLIISLPLTIIFLVNATDYIFNPDWWTMQKVLKLVKR